MTNSTSVTLPSYLGLLRQILSLLRQILSREPESDTRKRPALGTAPVDGQRFVQSEVMQVVGEVERAR